MAVDAIKYGPDGWSAVIGYYNRMTFQLTLPLRLLQTQSCHILSDAAYFIVDASNLMVSELNNFSNGFLIITECCSCLKILQFIFQLVKCELLGRFRTKQSPSTSFYEQ